MCVSWGDSVVKFDSEIVTFLSKNVFLPCTRILSYSLLHTPMHDAHCLVKANQLLAQGLFQLSFLSSLTLLYSTYLSLSLVIFHVFALVVRIEQKSRAMLPIMDICIFLQKMGKYSCHTHSVKKRKAMLSSPVPIKIMYCLLLFVWEKSSEATFPTRRTDKLFADHPPSSNTLYN